MFHSAQQFFYKYMEVVAGVTAGGILVAYGIPVSLMLPKYKKFTHLYKDGLEVPLGNRLKKITQEVVDTQHLTPDYEARLVIYHAFGQDAITKGSIYANRGALIGLPANYAYQNTSDIEKDRTVICRKHVDWDSQAGLALQNSLIFSDDALRFAIARDVFSCKSYQIYGDCIIPSVTFIASYSIGYYLNRMYRLRERLRIGYRFAMYGLIGYLGICSYLALIDLMTCSKERRVDRKAAELGTNYLQGGIEYYSKILERNMAIRTLMEDQGKKKSVYTMFGNAVEPWWRTPHVSPTHRKDLLTAFAEELKKKAETQTIESPASEDVPVM